MLMEAGRLAYFGTTKNARCFFDSLVGQCPSGVNPAGTRCVCSLLWCYLRSPLGRGRGRGRENADEVLPTVGQDPLERSTRPWKSREEHAALSSTFALFCTPPGFAAVPSCIIGCCVVCIHPYSPATSPPPLRQPANIVRARLYIAAFAGDWLQTWRLWDFRLPRCCSCPLYGQAWGFHIFLDFARFCARVLAVPCSSKATATQPFLRMP